MRGRRTPTAGRGFSLIELMIAIAVLLVIILATSQIFGTASRVTGTGHALMSVMQEAAVIEKRLRQDFSRLSPEGFFAIRQVAVPNNINGNDRLLNPMLRPEAMIRADQLVFFTDGPAGTSTFGVGGAGTSIKAQGVSARVYYGHAFQLRDGSPAQVESMSLALAHDPQQDVTPWHAGVVDMLQTRVTTITAGNVYQRSAAMLPLPSSINGTQPEARQWLLARQAVALARSKDQPPDSDEVTEYLAGSHRMARSILRETTPFQAHPYFGWSHEVRNGRMEGAASRIEDIWYYIREEASSPGSENWPTHQELISREAVYYPRGERIAPSASRVDQALTNHVIGSAVSSFIVEWTYENGVGDLFDSEGNRFFVNNNNEVKSENEIDDFTNWLPFGFYTNKGGNNFQPEHPWFGLNRSEPALLYGQVNACPACVDRGVGIYGDESPNGYQDRANYLPAQSIIPTNIEWFGTGQQYGAPFNDANIMIYEAIFGYNRNRPSAPNPNNGYVNEPHEQLAYTPWPSAIRVTMVLHDPQGRLEQGREFQFVIELPKRVRH